MCFSQPIAFKMMKLLLLCSAVLFSSCTILSDVRFLCISVLYFISVHSVMVYCLRCRDGVFSKKASCFVQILQNYEDILQKNKFYLQDKGRLKNALAGLVRCLSLLPCSNQKEGDSLSDNVLSC